jgi:hypothetical protein
MTRESQAKTFLGEIFRFRPDPSDPSKIFRGQCIAATFIGHHAETGLPDFRLILRGRSGKTLEISLITNYAYTCTSWTSQ